MVKDKESIPQENQCCKKKWKHNGAGHGAVYGLGLIGALFYFIQHASSFQMGLLGILKALIWPALLVYQLLGFFKF